MLFTELGLKETSLQAIAKLGFEKPSEIQEKSIPMLLADDIDFVGQAQTGTGKTAAFVLPLLEKIDLSKNHVQALIIAPTRELANQISEEIGKLSSCEKARTMAVYGGTSVMGQIKDLKRIKPQIVVGTAGRLMDFIGRKVLQLDQVRYAILDEADEMLDMGFFEDIQEILASMTEKKIWMFSATMPKDIVKLINKHFCEPQFVTVKKTSLTTDSVKQQLVVVHKANMTEALCRYLDFNPEIYGIVFTRTKIGAKQLTDNLNGRGFPSDAMHGDMSQDQRDLTMKKFKAKKIQLLICTDVAARGIDVSDLSHVINFELPQDNEAYVHRIGRTGRGSSKGTALSIIYPGELRRVSQIERITKAKIERITLPTVEEIKNILISKSVDKFTANMSESNGDESSFATFSARFAEVDKGEVLMGLYNFIYEQSLKRYTNAPDLNVAAKNGPVHSRDGYVRLFTNFGKSKGHDVADIIKFFCNNMKIEGKEIGRIDFKDTFSFVEVPTEYGEEALKLHETDYRGTAMVVEKSSEKPKSSNFSDRGARGTNRRGGTGGRGYAGRRGPGGDSRPSERSGERSGDRASASGAGSSRRRPSTDGSRSFATSRRSKTYSAGSSNGNR